MSSDITRDKNMIVQGFKKKGLSKEVMELINYDADYGLTREQIAKYADKKMDIERMRIYSECLRFDYDDRVIKVLTAEGVDITKLKMGLDFYRQGVPIEDVERILSSGEKAIAMKKQYDDILQKTDSLADEAEMEPEYVKKLTEYIEKLVIDGELDRNQLVQIKIAIEKGLTENQLEDIINSRVPAERMKEIIEIAELENSLQG